MLTRLPHPPHFRWEGLQAHHHPQLPAFAYASTSYLLAIEIWDNGIKGGPAVLGAVGREGGVKCTRNEVGRGGRSSSRGKLAGEMH